MSCASALILISSISVNADFVGHSSGRHSSNNHNHQLGRSGRQQSDATAVSGGIDFSGCVEDPDTGLCCVEKEETVTSLEKEPILECTHKNVEQCHYSYITQFTPTQVNYITQFTPTQVNYITQFTPTQVN